MVGASLYAQGCGENRSTGISSARHDRVHLARDRSRANKKTRVWDATGLHRLTAGMLCETGRGQVMEAPEMDSPVMDCPVVDSPVMNLFAQADAVLSTWRRS